MNKILYIFIILVVCFLSFTSFASAAKNLGDAIDMVKVTGGQAGFDVSQTGTAVFDTTVGVIIQTALSLLGVIFLVLMVYGGFLWMTDRGNEQQVKKAQGLISAAVIGLIIVLSSYAISYFVLDKIQANTLDTSGASAPPAS